MTSIKKKKQWRNRRHSNVFKPFLCLAFVLSTLPLYFPFIASEVLFTSFIRQGLAAVLNAFKVVLLYKVQPGGDPAYSLAWKNYIEASLTSSRCLEPCQSIKV